MFIVYLVIHAFQDFIIPFGSFWIELKVTKEGHR